VSTTWDTLSSERSARRVRRTDHCDVWSARAFHVASRLSRYLRLIVLGLEAGGRNSRMCVQGFR
jgi:hypothetical protein